MDYLYHKDMLHNIKLLASIVATGVALVAYIPYLIDMFKGKNKPHLYTWISILLITAIVAYIQLVGGSGIGAIPIVLGVGIDAVILFYCFKFGTKDIVFMDKLCLVASILGIAAYIILRHRPIIALAIVTIAELISFIPTFRKTRNDPYSESLPSYFLLMLKLSLILVALQKYSLLTVSYSALWLAVFIIFLTFTYHWRSKVKPPKQSHASTENELLI